MKSFNELKDKALENWFEDLFKSELKFEDYFPSPGQIELKTLDPKKANGHHLEIDGILRIHKTCILFEYTGQGSKFKNKKIY